MATQELSPDIRTIVAATEWVMDAPETQIGWADLGCHLVRQQATTVDSAAGYQRPKRGIRFDRTLRFCEDGSTLNRGVVFDLVNYAQPDSFHDAVPMTGEERWDVDVEELRTTQPDRVHRMADNLRALVTYYGVELQL